MRRKLNEINFLFFFLKKNIFKMITLLIVFFLIYIVFSVINTDYSSEIPRNRNCQTLSSFHLGNYFFNGFSPDVETNFPYNAYLDSANWCDVNVIIRDIKFIDSISPRTVSLGQRIFTITFTEKLETRIAKSLVNYNPDSLILILNWASRFNNYKDIDTNNSQFHRIVYQFWFNLISNKLPNYVINDPKIKYDFKFKHIIALCHEKQYFPSIKNSDREKIITYFVEQKFTYLFNRFWRGSGIALKLVVLFMVSSIFYAFFIIFRPCFQKK